MLEDPQLRITASPLHQSIQTSALTRNHRWFVLAKNPENVSKTDIPTLGPHVWSRSLLLLTFPTLRLHGVHGNDLLQAEALPERLLQTGLLRKRALRIFWRPNTPQGSALGFRRCACKRC